MTRDDDEKVDLKKLREDAGYTSQEAAARRVGVTVRAWGRWERGEVREGGEPAHAPKSVIDLLRLEAAARANTNNQNGEESHG